MKLGSHELTFAPVPARTGRPAEVQVTQRFFGAALGNASMTIDQAKQMAAEILLAVEAAQGK